MIIFVQLAISILTLVETVIEKLEKVKVKAIAAREKVKAKRRKDA